MKIFYPDYSRSILSITSSIQKKYGDKANYNSLKELDDIFTKEKINHTIVMLLDGLGTKILKKHLSKKAFLRKNQITNISTVFPPTTVAATTALLSGQTPSVSGWLGWSSYFEEFGSVVELFSGLNYSTNQRIDKDELNKLIGYTSFFQNYPNARTFYPDFDPAGYKTFDELLIALDGHLKVNKESFSYVYWGEPDYSMHEFGTYENKITKIIEELDVKIAKFVESLNDDTLLIIIADHGHIAVKPLFLSDHKTFLDLLSKRPSIESRAQSFSVSKENDAEFLAYFKKHFSRYFKLYNQEDALALFGIKDMETPHPLTKDFIGSYLAVAISDRYFVFDRDDYFEFRSHHAGHTKDEMLIPVIIYHKES